MCPTQVAQMYPSGQIGEGIHFETNNYPPKIEKKIWEKKEEKDIYIYKITWVTIYTLSIFGRPSVLYQIKFIYIALRTSANISKCCTETLKPQTASKAGVEARWLGKTP